MTEETPAPLPSAAPPVRRRPGRKPKLRTEPPTTPEAPPQRAAMRDEDPREAAARRAAEILGNFDGTEGGGGNEFDAPAPPPGWCYEWKVKTVLNQEDPGRTMAYRRTGWNEVPFKRHPEMMPVGYKGTTIERKGMVLMERPKEITDRFKEKDRQAARNQVQAKEAQLSQAPSGHFERNNKDAPLARIKKGYEPVEIPE